MATTTNSTTATGIRIYLISLALFALLSLSVIGRDGEISRRGGKKTAVIHGGSPATSVQSSNSHDCHDRRRNLRDSDYIDPRTMELKDPDTVPLSLHGRIGFGFHPVRCTRKCFEP